jgi:hypothetical protein
VFSACWRHFTFLSYLLPDFVDCERKREGRIYIYFLIYNMNHRVIKKILFDAFKQVKKKRKLKKHFICRHFWRAFIWHRSAIPPEEIFWSNAFAVLMNKILHWRIRVYSFVRFFFLYDTLYISLTINGVHWWFTYVLQSNKRERPSLHLIYV